MEIEKPAAFRASYSDWRIIKGRKVVQVVLELPIEKADEAYQVLGGMPIAANEIWCVVARLKPKGGDATDTGSETEISDPKYKPETKPRPVQSPGSVGAEKKKRSFDEMSPAQQAGMLCNERSFQSFLCETRYPLWDRVSQNGEYLADRHTSARWAGIAAEAVRRICKVSSRAEIDPESELWYSLVVDYRAWQQAVSVVPA